MPRKLSNDDPDKPTKSRVRFIFEPDRSSPNGVTYSWLIHRTYKGKEKVYYPDGRANSAFAGNVWD